MVNTPVLTVLLVTLSCMAMNSYAQSTAAPSNMTTAVPSNMTTAVPSNMTTAVTNMTTAVPSNMTTAVTNMTTAVTNMTTAVPSNMTTAGPNVTTAAPLMPNIAVVPLDTPLSREGCESEQLCAAEPSNCDPSTAGCFFLGVQQQSGQNFDFNLAGQSEGYIAATLSLDDTVGNNDTTYVCANNNGSVRFFSTILNDGNLIETELPVNSVRGLVNGTTIQCSFAATLPSQRIRNTNFAVQISSGTFNSTSGRLGTPNPQLRSTGVDLANPSASVTNEISNNATTTTVAATTGHAVTFRQSLTQALLIFAGVLGLTIL